MTLIWEKAYFSNEIRYLFFFFILIQKCTKKKFDKFNYQRVHSEFISTSNMLFKDQRLSTSVVNGNIGKFQTCLANIGNIFKNI